MKVEEKLEELGYTIATYANLKVAYKLVNNAYIHIAITMNGKIDDYNVRGNLFIKEQSDIDNIQTAYNILQSDLKELGEWKLIKK